MSADNVIYIMEEDEKWVVWDLLYIKKVPHYWMLLVKGSIFTSYCAPANNVWPKTFDYYLSGIDVSLKNNLIDTSDLSKHVTKAADLNYTNDRAHAGSERRNPKWTSLHAGEYKELVETLPLGKRYRAIDVGAIIPVIRLPDRLIGLYVKCR